MFTLWITLYYRRQFEMSVRTVAVCPVGPLILALSLSDTRETLKQDPYCRKAAGRLRCRQRAARLHRQYCREQDACRKQRLLRRQIRGAKMVDRPPNSSSDNPQQDESGMKRRLAHRFPFVALAELVEIKTGDRMAAQTTQLSSTGCYTGALNPFAEDTAIRVRISKDGKVFESAGRVLHVHAEFGMGIVFEDVAPDQQRILDAWVASHSSK